MLLSYRKVVIFVSKVDIINISICVMPWNYGPPSLQRIVRGSEKCSRVIEIVKPKREANNDFPLTIITIILVYTVYTSYFSSEYHNQGRLFV